MPSAIRPWFRLLRASFAAQTRYLPAALGGLIANLTFGFLKAAVLFATVRAAGGEVGGYDLATMSSYVWLSQALLGTVNLGADSDLADRVRTGDIAIDFARPLDVQTSYLAVDLGRSFFAIGPRAVPLILLGALTTGIAFAPPAGVLLGLVAVTLAAVLSFLGRYAVNILGLWLVETRGVRTLYMLVSSFLAGLFVPVPLFPGWLKVLANATPFPSLLQTPIDVLSGKVSGAAALLAVLWQLFWIAVIGAAGQLLTRRGRLKLEVQGG